MTSKGREKNEPSLFGIDVNILITRNVRIIFTNSIDLLKECLSFVYSRLRYPILFYTNINSFKYGFCFFSVTETFNLTEFKKKEIAKITLM